MRHKRVVVTRYGGPEVITVIEEDVPDPTVGQVRVKVLSAGVSLPDVLARIAEKFSRASEHYRNNPVALHLRAMNMVFEGLRQKGSMIIVPSTAVETMGLGALGGLTAFGQQAAGVPGQSADDGDDGDDGVE